MRGKRIRSGARGALSLKQKMRSKYPQNMCSTYLFKFIAAIATRMVKSCPNSRYSGLASPVAFVKLEAKVGWHTGKLSAEPTVLSVC